MAEKRKPGKSPSGRGRNYTPLREVVHCALPGASCGQQMISTDFQSAPIITGEAAFPLRWLCQLPLCELAIRKSFRKSIPFSKSKLYNRASEKSGSGGGGKMDRPITTLFMLMSVDGKISTGATDDLDVDKDFPKIAGVREGLHQYYEIEQTTDLWSLNSGRVQEKMGVNTEKMPDKTPVSFVVIDNNHLTEHGVRYFCARSKEFVLITSNTGHPAFQVDEDNLHIICQRELSLIDALAKLKSEFGCQRITIQSGGTLNGQFLREKLFDYIDIVVAPILIGGKDTSTLIDGKSLLLESELSQLGVLKLQECTVLEDSYLRLRYQVIH